MARLGWIPPDAAVEVGAQLGWPQDVVFQLLVDHGYRWHLRDALEHIDLATVEWTLEELRAGDLVAASHHPQKTRVETVASDPHKYLEERRTQGFDLWPSSWARPPIFIEAVLLDPPGEGLYLVEGHTRLGLLVGLFGLNEVAAESTHPCWVGQAKPAGPDPPDSA